MGMLFDAGGIMPVDGGAAAAAMPPVDTAAAGVNSQVGAMSGSAPVAGTADMLGRLAANGGRMNEQTGQVEGLLQNLNPVQKVGLEGLLGSLSPVRRAAPSGSGGAPSPNPQAMMQQMQRASQGGQQQSPGGGGSSTPAAAPQQTPPVSTPTATPYDFGAYRQQARAATDGINQMPYTFSMYDQMNGMKVEDIMKMFYPGWSPTGSTPTDTGPKSIFDHMLSTGEPGAF